MNSIMAMIGFINGYQRKFYDRSFVFVGLVLAMYTLQLILIFISVLIDPKRIHDDMVFFTINAFYVTGVVVILYSYCLEKAAQANQVEADIIRLLTQIKLTVQGTILEAARQGELYRSKDIDSSMHHNMFLKNDLNEKDLGVKFEQVTFEEFEDKQETLVAAIDNFIDFLNY